MRDSLTVLRKEALDTFGNRYSVRGPLWQAGITVFVTGILVPALDTGVWTHVPVPLILYSVLPASFAAALAADAFAGEVERGTLETLLATPLPSGAIFFGKTALITFSVLCVSALSLSAAVSTAWYLGRLRLPLAPGLFLGVLGGAVACAVLIGGLTIAVSARVPVARSAHQIGTLITFAVAGLAAFALEAAEPSLSWIRVLCWDGCVLLVGLGALLVSVRCFRRESLFERR